MKVQNNNYYPNFQAGLTKQMQYEIKTCDIHKISQEFTKANIETDFKNNKIIAWCCLKCYKLLKTLNLSLPNGILVEDFNNLNIEKNNSIGFNNVAPVRLYKDKKIIIPEKTIFFNEFKTENYLNGNKFWESIDLLSDEQYLLKLAPTDNFLDIFLHEFAHSAHEGNLIKNYGGEKTLEIFKQNLNPKLLEKYEQVYSKLFSELGLYASHSPTETIASDLTKRIIKQLDNSLNIQKNFVNILPYKNLTFFEKIFGINSQINANNIIRKIWHGKKI